MYWWVIINISSEVEVGVEVEVEAREGGNAAAVVAGI